MSVATNTLTLEELERAFRATMAQYGAEMLSGIEDGRVSREDGLPWFEVFGGSLGFKTAEAFAQDLADALRCRVLLNAAHPNAAKGVMDFDDRRPGPGGVLPPYGSTPKLIERMADYGLAFSPR